MLKKRYGAVTVHAINNGKVVPKIVSGLCVDIINCTSDDLAELKEILGDAAVIGKDGTLTFRHSQAATHPVTHLVFSERTGFEVTCTKCGTVVLLQNKIKAGESIEMWYDKCDEEIVFKCTGCGQEVTL